MALRACFGPEGFGVWRCTFGVGACSAVGAGGTGWTRSAGPAGISEPADLLATVRFAVAALDLLLPPLPLPVLPLPRPVPLLVSSANAPKYNGTMRLGAGAAAAESPEEAAKEGSTCFTLAAGIVGNGSASAAIPGLPEDEEDEAEEEATGGSTLVLLAVGIGTALSEELPERPATEEPASTLAFVGAGIAGAAEDAPAPCLALGIEESATEECLPLSTGVSASSCFSTFTSAGPGIPAGAFRCFIGLIAVTVHSSSRSVSSFTILC